MSIFTDLTDRLVRSVATSAILKWADGYKLKISMVAQAINSVLTALYLSAPILDQQFGTGFTSRLDFLNDNLLLVSNFISVLGIQFGLKDKAAKERIAEKK